MNSIDKDTGKWESFHSTHQGASHKKVDKVCQDASYSSCGEKYLLSVVCDGHGGANYFRSDRGSKLAVESVKETIKKFMADFLNLSVKKQEQFLEKDVEGIKRQLVNHIIYNWRKMVEKDYQENPFTEQELAETSSSFQPQNYIKAYGTTLIMTLLCPKLFWLGLHIGDGKCVAHYEDGSWEQPIPWDNDCFLNVTTSLCDEKAVDKFRYCFHTNRFPVALFIGSDGVDDSFSSDDNLYGFYQEVLQTFQEKSVELAKEEIDNYLPVLSQKGSGDDISLSGIINMNILCYQSTILHP